MLRIKHTAIQRNLNYSREVCGNGKWTMGWITPCFSISVYNWELCMTDLIVLESKVATQNRIIINLTLRIVVCEEWKILEI